MKAAGAAFLGFFLWNSVPAEGALYQFALKGEVTYALFGDVEIGAPVTIRYLGDSLDTNPDPMIGVYSTSAATIKFPDFTITTPDAPAVLYVALNGAAVDIIQFLHVTSGYGLSVYFRFADGTLQSDALPLELPLSSAIARTFTVFSGTWDIYRGNIMSYVSVEVPEPSAMGLLALTLMLPGRSNTKRQQRRVTVTA